VLGGMGRGTEKDTRTGGDGAQSEPHGTHLCSFLCVPRPPHSPHTHTHLASFPSVCCGELMVGQGEVAEPGPLLEWDEVPAQLARNITVQSRRGTGGHQSTGSTSTTWVGPSCDSVPAIQMAFDHTRVQQKHTHTCRHNGTTLAHHSHMLGYNFWLWI
jgi:hypothetical protein